MPVSKMRLKSQGLEMNLPLCHLFSSGSAKWVMHQNRAQVTLSCSNWNMILSYQDMALGLIVGFDLMPDLQLTCQDSQSQ
jgi:hypothetical protein